MRGQKGMTMLELVTACAVVAVLAAVTVPGAAKARAAVSSAEGARRLALVLRAAQARAQSTARPVRVEVSPDGRFVVLGESGDELAGGRLGARVSSTYPGGVLEFGERGWACLPGASSPRAGHFEVAGASHTVTVQLSGCVRCT